MAESVTQAVAERILELCTQRKIAVNALANMAGIPPMTLYCILNGKSKNPGIVNIKMVCDALEISLASFFDAEVFTALTQESK